MVSARAGLLSSLIRRLLSRAGRVADNLAAIGDQNPRMQRAPEEACSREIMKSTGSLNTFEKQLAL